MQHSNFQLLERRDSKVKKRDSQLLPLGRMRQHPAALRELCPIRFVRPTNWAGWGKLIFLLLGSVPGQREYPIASEGVALRTGGKLSLEGRFGGIVLPKEAEVNTKMNLFQNTPVSSQVSPIIPEGLRRRHGCSVALI
jgi:hypothetical protein